KPGQFLHLALDAYEPSDFWPDSRAFSIASPPQQRERLGITYSVQGRFTARMERELIEGKFVWIKLSYGEFIVQATSDVVLFAGGTGITAFTAFLDGLTPAFPHKVYLAYGARERRLLIYRDLAERCAAMVPQLYPFYFVEHDADGESAPRSEIVGRLSVGAMWKRIENPQAATYYISGPPLMLKAIARDLSECGVRADAIRTDAWE
ncbi:MAG: FAD-dependent oxidoreductase, partial [Chloroflexota bacterium]|nr:FAD-dependent oxidoreductase [Chloroflexota bacterium]